MKKQFFTLFLLLTFYVSSAQSYYSDLEIEKNFKTERKETSAIMTLDYSHKKDASNSSYKQTPNGSFIINFLNKTKTKYSIKYMKSVSDEISKTDVYVISNFKGNIIYNLLEMTEYLSSDVFVVDRFTGKSYQYLITLSLVDGDFNKQYYLKLLSNKK